MQPKPAGRESFPWDMLYTMCVCPKSSQAQRNRTLWAHGCSPSVGVRVCWRGESVYSWVYSSPEALLGELWRGGVYASTPTDPSSLPQGLCFLPGALWLEGVCVHVREWQGVGEEWWRGKEAFCGPSNWNTPALFSQTWARTHTHSHTIPSRNLFLVTEGGWVISDQEWVCICQLQQTCKHTHANLILKLW